MNLNYFFATVVILLFVTGANAQMKPQLINSGDIIKSGVLVREENYYIGILHRLKRIRGRQIEGGKHLLLRCVNGIKIKGVS